MWRCPFFIPIEKQQLGSRSIASGSPISRSSVNSNYEPARTAKCASFSISLLTYYRRILVLIGG